MTNTGFENGERTPVTAAAERTSHFCQHCKTNVDLVCPKCRSVYLDGDQFSEPQGMASRQADRFRRILLHALDSGNSKLWLHCFLIATGDAAAFPGSMHQLGREFHVTRAAISQICRDICKTFEMRPSPRMKRERASESFRKSNWRPAPSRRKKVEG